MAPRGKVQVRFVVSHARPEHRLPGDSDSYA